MIGILLASQVSRAVMGRYARVIVLDDDYPLRRRLGESVPEGVSVEGLGGAFDRLYEELEGPLLRTMDELGRRASPDVWWSGQVASRSSTATHLMRDVIYARFARDLVARKPAEDVLLACADPGLLRCVARMLREAGMPFRCESTLRSRLGGRIRRLGFAAALAAYGVVDFLRTRRLTRLLPVPAGLGEGKKRAVLRTWIPEGAFAADGTYQDRNFGGLPAYLRRQGFDVLFVPMFFDLRRPLSGWFRLMADSGERFLVPHHLVGLRSLVGLLALEARRLLVRYRGARVDGIDISGILRFETFRHAFDPAMVRLNLISPLLGRMARRGVHVDTFAYPFENNAPEKVFILAKRRFYPRAEMVAFQHSVWLSRQAGAQMLPEEAASHPLPDRIVCGGRLYLAVLADLGFPRERLAVGASLRFAAIRGYPIRPGPARRPGEPPALFLALPYDRNMSFELLAKLRAALGDDLACRVRVKTHPLLGDEALRDFVRVLAFPSLEIVEVSTRDGLAEADAAVNIGTSVVHMEAVACGVPLVRVMPENTFFLDPMKWLDYPIAPAQTPSELRERLRQALTMRPEELAAWADRVKAECFEEANDATMRVFLNGRPAAARSPQEAAG